MFLYNLVGYYMQNNRMVQELNNYSLKSHKWYKDISGVSQFWDEVLVGRECLGKSLAREKSFWETILLLRRKQFAAKWFLVKCFCWLPEEGSLWNAVSFWFLGDFTGHIFRDFERLGESYWLSQWCLILGQPPCCWKWVTEINVSIHFPFGSLYL